ncbi:hypothetical protein [Kibdelosporangium phytohabitans]|uniref:Uncharacterized protein n=1 Tax=Kibdelosporangium phytohabitans TaxID=860235 RepID=A0A0N9HWL2_9PSEU|nr:hypothetical protein [Kibdelosporangium phytohabitans]ALG11845.1 hypothetical protein AOZ06_37670 [Kibdelosporangium phytohabitans]MBE1463266.1 hypothetical protein [Kibdelosporangium phytohabitans]
MTDAMMRDGRQVGPVRVAVALWWLAAGLTALIAFVTFMTVADKLRWDDMPRVLANAAIMIVLAIVTITHFGRGKPVARVALTGMAVYYVWTLIIGVTVLVAGESEAPAVLVLVEVARTLCAVIAAILSFTTPARAYFRLHNARAARVKATIIAGWAWLAAIAAMTVIVAGTFIDSLPSHGRSWIQWATGTNAIAAALVASLVLCLLPAYAALVRQFEYGRQWARITLCVIGVFLSLLAVIQALDVFDDRRPQTLDTVNAVLGLVFVAAVVAGFALSFLPAANAHFRRTPPPEVPQGGDYHFS